MAIDAADVKLVTGITLADPAITAQIAIAEAWIVQLEISTAPCHDATSLDNLAIYLTAHLAALVQRQLTAQKIDDAADSYGGSFGKMLDFTQYGQTAKLLDCSGILERAGKRQVDLTFFGGAGVS